jgi:hypothetical protein
MLTRKLSWKHSLFFAVAAVSAAPFLVACGSKDSPPPQNAMNNPQGQCPPNAAPGYPGCPQGGAPGQQGGYVQGQGGYQGPPGGQPGYPPQGQPTAPAGYPTAPATAPTAPATAPATAPPPIAGDATDLAIRAAATQYAPGMQPEGTRASVTVTEGQSNSVTMTLQGGKCYAVVAVGATGGVMGVDLRVMLPLLTTPAASDTSAIGVAVAGKGAQAICPLTPLPVPYTIQVVARKGSGTVGVQLYSKIK